VLVPAYGWIPFEPRPSGFANPATDNIWKGVKDSSESSTTEHGSGNVTGAGNSPTGPDILKRDGTDRGAFGHRGSGSFGQVPIAARKHPRSYAGLILLVLAVALVATAIGIPLWKTAWRRRELRRARTPRETALAAYRVFSSRAADVGYGRRPEETMPEYRTRLIHDLPSPNGDLDRLTRLAATAAYSSHDPTSDDATSALSSGRGAIASVRKDVPFVRRVAGTFRPSV